MKENVVAIQQTHQMYADLVGANSRKKVILIVIILSAIAGLLSIMGSAYGLYYDWYLDYGHGFSLFFGILGGLFIEAVKYLSIVGFFAWKSWRTKVIFTTLLIGFTSIAVTLHYFGVENMKRTKSVEIISQVQDHNYAMQLREQDRKDKITDIAKKITHNGTIRDDAMAMKTLSNINSYKNSMFSRGDISPVDMMQINRVEKAAKNRAKSLKIVLPLLEILSIFGFLGAWLKTHSTPNSVKRIVERQQFYATINALKSFKKKNNVQSEDNRFADMIIRAMDQEFFEHYGVPYPLVESNKNNNIDEKPKNSETSNNTNDGASTTQDKHSLQEKKRYIDMTLFEYKEAEMLKIVFQNGQVNEPDMGLLPKRVAKEEYKRIHKSGEREAIDLYETVLDKLLDHNYVYMRGRYKSKCHGIKTVVVTEEGRV